MFALLNRFRRSERGVAAIELALVTPLFLMLFLSAVELGHLIFYSIQIEKALRSAVTFAGRHTAIDAATITGTRNLAMTNTVDGTGNWVVPGYASGATVDVTTQLYTGSGFTQLVVSVKVKVPYVALVPDFVPALQAFAGGSQVKGGPYYINLTHQQAMIGN